MAPRSSKSTPRRAQRPAARQEGVRVDKNAAAKLRKRIRTPADFFAHAIAIEREAVARYTEFAQAMSDHGLDVTARLFQRLARFEYEHLDSILKKTAGLTLPELVPEEYAWLDKTSPEAAAHEFVFRLLTPHDALTIALQGERRARDYFATIRESTADPEIRGLAREYAREEDVHIAWIERMLDQLPAPYHPSDRKLPRSTP